MIALLSVRAEAGTSAGREGTGRVEQEPRDRAALRRDQHH